MTIQEWLLKNKFQVLTYVEMPVYGQETSAQEVNIKEI